ncbi:rab-GTPase-TBC domain-containing protein [Phascolomyces articulosus]|uniref:Rab-GTPase-TBC domain-containing protein n=1 Tax=Phascolomyces articulosus TaxID=60185 RepID=A0AAD5JWI1_9FUNG|nr:rab-GTPase-TBC domain-containing protein [Phascolomyces articulosus]
MSVSKYLKILQRQHHNQDETENSLTELRWGVLHSPCPLELRGWVWKVLLRLCDSVSASCYIKLVERGPSPMDTKIRNDTFRTMTTDEYFLEQVSEDMLIRVLNAFVWISQQDSRAQDTSEELQLRSSLQQKSSAELTYVQGMNVLAAPFLMVLPEMEAFFAFSTFLWQWCPLYVHPNLNGVHCGLKLVDMCLRALDPELYGYLLGKGLTANMYAFPSVLTFSACTPPVTEVLRLWDIMFAFGFHLNILYIVAQLQLARNDIFNSPSPMKILRKLPPLKAHAIIELAVTSCKELPSKLYENLVRHLYDERVTVELGVTSAPVNNQHQSNRYYRR